VAAVEELDETVARVRALGPVPFQLTGWDHASIWGWDETTGSLYAHLWRNTDDPGGPPPIQIGADELTPEIKFPATLAQHIAMAIDCDPWKVAAILLSVDDHADESSDAQATEGGTVVTITEGYSIWWPSDASPGR
jgi:hypothetical protein